MPTVFARLRKLLSIHCPQCGKELSDFAISFEDVLLVCGKCGAEISPSVIVNDSTAEFFYEQAPEEKRDRFFEQLGYRKRLPSKVVRVFTVSAASVLLVLALVLVAIGITNISSLPKAIGFLVAGAVLLWRAIDLLRWATVPKLRRSKP
jgi:hypothetical protein